MTHTDLGQIAAANAKASGTTLTFTNTSASTIPAGALIILSVGSDNYASTSAPTLSFTTNNTGGTWNLWAGPVSQGVTTTAGQGIWGWAYYVYTGNSIAVGGTIAVLTWSNAVVARAGIMKAYTGMTGTPYGIATNSNAFGNPAVTTAVNATSGDLVVACPIAENPSITGDSDTTNGSWTAIVTTATSGSTSGTNVAAGIQDKEVTATGTQTFNMTSGNDAISMIGVFPVLVITPISASDTCAVTISESTATTAGITASDTAAITINSYASKPNLQFFKDAIANRASARVNVGMLGCSLMEGYPATADKTPAQYLAKKLRAIYPTTGNPSGFGRISIPTAAMVGITPFTVTAGTGGNVGTSNATNGWGANHQTWFTNGSLAVPPILVCTIPNAPWTSFDIDLIRVAGYSATAGKYRVDGGSWVNFALNTATGIVNEKLHVATAVNSTIEITIETGNAASYVIVNGITGYNGDENKGIQCHAFGHSGYRVNQWRVDANPTYGFRYDQALEDLDLLIISDLGVNDAQSLSSAQFAADLEDFFNYIVLVHNVPIVMVSAWDMTAGVTYVESWTNYRDVMKNFCTAKDIPFIDLSTIMPATPNAIYHTDNTHGNTAGDAYRIMADIIAYAITNTAIDGAAISVTETSSLGINTVASDTAAVTVTETSSIFRALSASDGAAISVAETSAPLDPYDIEVLADSPYVYDNTRGAFVLDSSGNNRTITLPGGVPTYQQTGPGSLSDAVLWPDSAGATEYYASISTSSIASTPFTLECWFKVDAIPTSNTPLLALAYGYGNNSRRPFEMFLATDGKVKIISSTSSTSAATLLSSSTTVSTGVWYHAVAIGDSGVTRKIRLNKVDVASDSPVISFTTSSSLFIHGGGSDTNAVAGDLRNGSAIYIARPAFYTAVISDARLDAHYDAMVSATSITGSESTAITITETSDVTQPTVGSESTAVSIAETSAIDTFSTSSDSAAITVTEGSQLTIFSAITANDSAAITIAETSGASVAISATDGNGLAVSETSASSGTVTASDTAAVTITESSSPVGNLPGAETTAVSVTEAATVFVSLSASDGAAISVADTSTPLVLVTASDTAAVTISDTSTSNLFLNRTDTTAVGVIDVSIPSLTGTVTDGAALTIAETSDVSIFVDMNVSDTGAIGVTETSAIAIAHQVNDSAAITTTETSSVFVTVAASDGASLSIVETAASAGTVSASDTAAVTAAETTNANTTSYLPGTETASIGVSESANVLVDDFASDTGSVSVDESTSTTVGFSGNESSAIMVTETATIFRALTATDGGAVGVTETHGFFKAITADDQNSISVDDSPNLVVQFSADDPIAWEIIDVSSLVSFEAGPRVFVRVTEDDWALGHMYIRTETGWKHIRPKFRGEEGWE
jgi:hypothetical protein